MPTEPSPSERLAVGAFSALLVGAVLAPIRQNRRAEKRDGFPLSYYPMFSARRPARSTVHHFRGIDADGGFVTVPYTCAGIGGFNQVRRQIHRIALEGRAEELCAQAAAEVARLDPLRAVRRLQLVKARYHLDDWFLDTAREPVNLTVLAEVAVPRA
jgi:hypothetical protein